MLRYISDWMRWVIMLITCWYMFDSIYLEGVMYVGKHAVNSVGSIMAGSSSCRIISYLVWVLLVTLFFPVPTTPPWQHTNTHPYLSVMQNCHTLSAPTNPLGHFASQQYPEGHFSPSAWNILHPRKTSPLSLQPFVPMLWWTTTFFCSWYFYFLLCVTLLRLKFHYIHFARKSYSSLK